jgi:prepilin-type N-terminal cleavage/methylation domain-containing protein
MRIGKHNKAFTLAEMVIAMAIMVVIMAAILPQFRIIRNSWASSEASANITQNGRVLEEHIIRNLSAAKQLISVSSSATNEGFITFEDNLGIEKQYKFNSGYVDFNDGTGGAQLAGPVSRFQVSCYSLDDLVTPITDGNNIRFVEVETDFTNSNLLGTDRTFITSAYLRTNVIGCDIVGHWKLDETSGSIAADSSYSNDGTLYNMSSPGCWVTGQINNGLDFDGSNDYVSLPIGSVISSLTNCTIAVWVNWDGGSSWQRIWDFGTGTTRNMFLTSNNGTNGRPRFAITTSGTGGEDQTTAPSALSTGRWYHIAVTIDADNHTHKMYIDGIYVQQNTFGYLNPSDLGATNQNYLAKSQYADPYFNGKLDSVRIYNRVLSATEIAELANTLRYREFNEAKAATNTTSITIDTPTTDEGDLLIAAVATDGSTTFSLPSGWTEIDQGNSSSQVTLGAWWKLADASEATNYTFNWSASEQAYGWMMRFSGHDAANPIDYPPSTGNDSDSFPTSLSVSTTVDNCIILRLGAFDDDNIAIYPTDSSGLPSGHTPITMDESAAAVAGSVTYNTFAEYKRSSIGTSVVIPKPTGTVSGDLLIAAVSVDTDVLASIAPPAGWTLILKDTYSPQITLGVWYKKAGGSEGTSYTFTWTGSKRAYGWAMRFSGQDPTNPINGTPTTSKGSGSATPSCPSVTTTVDNAMIVRIGAFDSNPITVDSPGLTGHTAITMDYSNNASTASSGGAGYKYLAARGSSGTSAFALTASEQFVTVTLAIAPGASAGGTVSGGAGYVTLPTASSSGTSDFSLGSANEARMITVAITPDTTSNDDCQIRP